MLSRCINCRFPFGVDVDGEFGKAAEEQRNKIEELLKYLPTSSLKYDGRKISDLPFRPSELRIHEANIFRILQIEELERIDPGKYVLTDDERAYVLKICEEVVGKIYYDRNS